MIWLLFIWTISSRLVNKPTIVAEFPTEQQCTRYASYLQAQPAYKNHVVRCVPRKLPALKRKGGI